MNKDTIIKVLIVGAGGYLLYTWLVQTGNWDKLFGVGSSTASTNPAVTGATTTSSTQPGTTVSTPGSGVMKDAPPPTITVTNSALRTALLSAAANGYNAQVSGSGDSRTMLPDEWSFYYAQITGTPIPPATYMAALTKAGIQSGSSSMITVDQFIAALSGVGLGGLSLTDGNGGSVIRAGGRSVLNIRGALANAPVSSEVTFNGQSLGSHVMGITDGHGNLTLSVVQPDTTVGTWNLRIAVGGYAYGQVTFTVVPDNVIGIGDLVPARTALPTPTSMGNIVPVNRTNVGVPIVVPPITPQAQPSLRPTPWKGMAAALPGFRSGVKNTGRRDIQ